MGVWGGVHCEGVSVHGCVCTCGVCICAVVCAYVRGCVHRCGCVHMSKGLYKCV